MGSSAKITVGVVRHGDRDDGALAHAAGELVRIVVDPLGRVRDAHLGQQFDGPGLGGLLRDVLVGPDRLGDLPPDGVDGVQRCHRVLEDHRDAGAPHLGELLLLQAEELTAFEADGAPDLGARGEESHAGQRGHGLARARLADDAEHLTGLERQVHPAHGVHHTFLGREVDLQTLNLQHRLRHQALTRLFLGSKASRSPSPTRKMERMRMIRKTTGKTKSHHSVVAES